ncbi:unnamed protein product [Larinioides sclopetarius]|uniref:Uncharacterized protein n=1 Tax=Larinioides sclopetarius TaxID=280406 RepID=A0AAV1ZB72_9ARAC
MLRYSIPRLFVFVIAFQRLFVEYPWRIVSMSTVMDVVKATKRKTNMCSRSNVLKKIVDSLENEKCQHMLYWYNKIEKEFVIKFVHMNNPESKNADYLELFKELDKLSNNYKNYLQDEKYDHKCKVRCKANLRKLVDSGALTFMGKTRKGKSILLRKYKLNFDVSSAKSAVSEGRKMTKRCNINGFRGRETVQGITYIKGNLNVENLPNEQSHCLCLSKHNPINIYVNIPFGETSISNANTIVHSLLDACCTTENRNEDTRNMLLQNSPLTVYEHEKQMDKKDDALHAMPVENPVLCSSSTSCSNIETSNNCECMKYCNRMDKKIHCTMDNQNNGALYNNYTESLNMESVGKPGFPYYINNIEEATEVINLVGEHYTSSENELQYNYGSLNGLQNENFQNTDLDVKQYAQLVPCSPQNHERFMDVSDLFSQYLEDYSPDINKPLQDNDPFWFDKISDGLNDNLLEENETNNEDFFSF